MARRGRYGGRSGVAREAFDSVAEDEPISGAQQRGVVTKRAVASNVADLKAIEATLGANAASHARGGVMLLHEHPMAERVSKCERSC